MIDIDPLQMLDAPTLVGVALLLAGGALVAQNPEVQRAGRALLENDRVRSACRNALSRFGDGVLDALFGPNGPGALPA